jgi:hypothetical protein
MYAPRMRKMALLALTASLAIPGVAWAQDDVDDQGDDSEPAPKKKKTSPNVTVTPNDQVTPDDQVPAGPPPLSTPTDRKGRPLKSLPYEDYDSAPPGYKLGGKSRKGLWIPGITLLSSGYLLSAATSLGGIFVEGLFCFAGAGCYDGREWGWGFLPLVGPFVITADNDFNTGWRVTYGIFGVLQNAGLALTIAGFTAKEKSWVLQGSAEPSREPQLMLGPGYAGLRVNFD